MIAEEYGTTNEPTVSTNQSDSESSSDESSDSSDSDDAAGNDVLDNGKEGSSSERDSDSDSVSDDGQRKQQIIEKTTQKPPNKLTIQVNGEEKEATFILFVGNLSWATEEKTLEQAFVEFGGVRGVRIITKSNGRSRGFGYVEFTSSEKAAKALEARPSLELDGRSLRLDFSTPRPGTANVLNHDQQRQEIQERPDNERDMSVGAVVVDTNEVNSSQTIQDEVSMIDYNTDYDEERDDVDDAKTRVLIKLYVLADKLIDPCTANLVIDTLISHFDALSHLPEDVFINIVYKYTPTGSPLHTLFRDWYIHELNHFAYQIDFDAKIDLPVEFLKDVLAETGRICSGNENRKIAHVLRSKAIGRPTGHYHQKVESSQSNGGK